MADYYVQSETLTDIADAIRAKKNSSNSMAVKDMANEISSISSGINTNDATATAEDILSGETAYVKGEKVTGTMPAATQATPSITINSSGLITATATQAAGYVTAGSKSATKQLAFQAAKTIMPTTASQIAVSSGYYTGGDITIAGDANLIAGNIKNGVSIFGVAGSYEGGGGSSDIELTNVTVDFSWSATIKDYAPEVFYSTVSDSGNLIAASVYKSKISK